ncbi:pre-toxin TG domain-containing protein, partial [Fusobacterium nucleatum]
KKAKNEIEDIGNVIENTVNPPGEDKRNFFKNLRAQRWDTSFYNVTGSRMEELSRQFKAGEIDEKQLKEAARDLIKGYGKDIGIDYEVVYLDEETMPKDAKGSTGSSYILDEKNRKVLIPIDVSKIGDINELFGTLTEEVSHGKDALEGRQDKKVAEDKSNNEKGLESLGRPANDYVKNKLGEDNNSKIKLSTDGINLTNANVGEKVGDYLPKHEIDAAGGVEKVLHFETSEEIAKIVGHKSNLEVLDNFLQGITNKNLWSGVYDFTPGVGDAKGFIEGLTGEDLITGEKISFFNRIIGGIPLIGRAADIFKTVNKPIKNGADFLVNLILDSSKGISKMDNINDTTKLVSVAEGVGDLGSDVTKVVVKEIKVADDSVDIAKTSKNVEKISDVSEDITKAVANEQTLEVIKTPLLKSNEVVLKDIKYETYYRSMNYNDYKKLIETGRLPSTKETFISPRQIYSEKYSGVLVEFKLEPGTTDKLAKIAVRDKSKKLIERYPNMSLVYNGWNYNNVYFKWEKKMQMNIGLGKGAGINLFNESIRSYEFKKIIK